MSLEHIINNPYRVLGVLSNSPLKERVGNQNRLAAFAKVGKETSLPYDFIAIIGEKPVRTAESIASATTSINLDKNQLKYALFWFIKGSSIDEIAIKHLQAGNIDKAKELFEKHETFSSLINLGIIAFLNNDIPTGFNYISKVIHNNVYRENLLETLGITNLVISEEELAEIYISELLKEVSPTNLLSEISNAIDKEIIERIALDDPISKINAAIAIAKSAEKNNPDAQLEAGITLMNSTKSALKQVKDIAGASSPQYQIVADNVAKNILQCSINYYNNASDMDIESPRKAMVLQSYVLTIAVGQLTKDRCKENYDILKQAVDNMPPAEVAVEARKVKEALRNVCQLPDEISHAVTLIDNTEPLLQSIKSKLGENNAFYLSLSTQVVGKALNNIIEEVNQALVKIDRFSRSSILNARVTIMHAFNAIKSLDSFDMEYEFKTKHYYPNRASLEEMYDNCTVSTSNSSSSHSSNAGCWISIIIAIIIFLLRNL